MVLKEKEKKKRVSINLVSLKITVFPREPIEGVPILASGPGFQKSGGALRSISQYFLDNDNTDATGKR